MSLFGFGKKRRFTKEESADDVDELKRRFEAAGSQMNAVARLVSAAGDEAEVGRALASTVDCQKCGSKCTLSQALKSCEGDGEGLYDLFCPHCHQKMAISLKRVPP